MGGIAQTAAIDVAANIDGETGRVVGYRIERTIKDIDGSGVTAICIDITEGGAAIDVAIEFQGFVVRIAQPTEIDLDIARGGSL